MAWARAYLELPDTARRRFRTAEQQAALEKELRRPFHLAQRDAILRDVRDMQRAGVAFVAGSVSGSVAVSTPGATIHDELFWLVQSGATPLEAIRAATLNPARFLQATDSMGTVRTGKVADLLLLDADPLEAVDNIRRIRGVVLNGRYLDRASLDGLISDAEMSMKSRMH
jgi:imidazolonepropionase-like amidohydrolase